MGTLQHRWPALVAATFALALIVDAAFGVRSVEAATREVVFRGLAICTSGRSNVGVWVRSSDGGSGWAAKTSAPGYRNALYYSKKIKISGSSTTVSISVGCGGSTSSWGSTNNSGNKTVTDHYVYNVDCADPATGTGKCVGPPTPNGGKSTNHFSAGYCTWGAAKYWKAAQGTYPSWSGNASAWATNSGAQGWKIGKVPRERALMVWLPKYKGDPGHVAWVKSVSISGSTYLVTIDEMNVKGRYVWSTRTVKWSTTSSAYGPNTIRFVLPRAGAANVARPG